MSSIKSRNCPKSLSFSKTISAMDRKFLNKSMGKHFTKTLVDFQSIPSKSAIQNLTVVELGLNGLPYVIDKDFEITSGGFEVNKFGKEKMTVAVGANTIQDLEAIAKMVEEEADKYWGKDFLKIEMKSPHYQSTINIGFPNPRHNQVNYTNSKKVSSIMVSTKDINPTIHPASIEVNIAMWGRKGEVEDTLVIGLFYTLKSIREA